MKEISAVRNRVSMGILGDLMEVARNPVSLLGEIALPIVELRRSLY